tara:strand:+ start:28 stop:204 length:177 start_codon:yes stop_codon:yes gene_type:complete
MKFKLSASDIMLLLPIRIIRLIKKENFFFKEVVLKDYIISILVWAVIISAVVVLSYKK